jgi:hypothetical protein
MSDTAQKRALRNYRSRLTKRGIARFEVLGLDTDRDLIRSIARLACRLLRGKHRRPGRIQHRDCL